MTDEAALLAAIAADPDDDTVRLAFADYLDERGGEPNEVWAAFIRGGCLSARGRTDRIGEREAWALKFWHYYTKPWLELLGFPWPRLSPYDWGRGFPREVWGDFSVFKAAREKLTARCPMQKVYLREVTLKDVKEMSAWPNLGRVSSVTLETMPPQRPLRDTGFLAIARAPLLREVRALHVTVGAPTDRGMNALLDSPYAAQLTRLQISWAESPSRLLSAAVCDRVRTRFGYGALGELPPRPAGELGLRFINTILD